MIQETIKEKPKLFRIYKEVLLTAKNKDVAIARFNSGDYETTETWKIEEVNL